MSSTKSGAIFYPPVEVPEVVELNGDYLNWTRPRTTVETVERYADGRFSSVRPTDASLLRFTRLTDSPSIVDYAKRSGVLGASQIDPRSGQEGIELPDKTVWTLGGRDPEPWRKDDQHGREPVALWLLLARRVQSILRINASLQGRTKTSLPTVGSQEDWRTLGWTYPMEDVNDAQCLLLGEVNYLLRLGKVGLELGIVRWSKQKTPWDVGIGYRHLAGGLAYRLLLTVAGENRLYACDNCQVPYIRLARAPRPGQENFCENCTDVAKLRATQRYREGRNRKREKRS